jgi:hypothetical protein
MNIQLLLEYEYPDETWSFNGESTYENLEWDSNNSISKPTEQEFQIKWTNLVSTLKLKHLRDVRDNLLNECDWIVIKSYSRGETVPTNWAEYMQTLRDLPETATVQLDSNLFEVTNLTEILPIRPDGKQLIGDITKT